MDQDLVELVKAGVKAIDVCYPQAIYLLSNAYNYSFDCASEIVATIRDDNNVPSLLERQLFPLIVLPSDKKNMLLRQASRLLFYELGNHDQAISILEKAQEERWLDLDNHLQLAIYYGFRSTAFGDAANQKPNRAFSIGRNSPNKFNVKMTEFVLRYLSVKKGDNNDDIMTSFISLPNDMFEYCTTLFDQGKISPEYYPVMVHSFMVMAKMVEVIMNSLQWPELEMKKYRADLTQLKKHSFDLLCNTNYDTCPGKVPLSHNTFMISYPEIVGLEALTKPFVLKSADMDGFLVSRAVMEVMDSDKCVGALSLFTARNGKSYVMMNKTSYSLQEVISGNLPTNTKLSRMRDYLLLQEETQVAMTKVLIQDSDEHGPGFFLPAPIEDTQWKVRTPLLDFSKMAVMYLLGSFQDDKTMRLSRSSEVTVNKNYSKYHGGNPILDALKQEIQQFADHYMGLEYIPQNVRDEFRTKMFVFSHLDCTPENGFVNLMKGHMLALGDWSQHGIVPCVYGWGITLGDSETNHLLFGDEVYSNDEDHLLRDVWEKHESRYSPLPELDYSSVEKLYKACKAFGAMRRCVGINARLGQSKRAEEMIDRAVSYLLDVESIHDGTINEPTSLDELLPNQRLAYTFVTAVMQAPECHDNLKTRLSLCHNGVVRNAEKYLPHCVLV